MRLLLDSHILLWLDRSPERVPAWQRDILADLTNDVFVSAVTAWELAIKKRANRLVLSEPVSALRARLGFIELPITMRHGEIAAALEWDHRDPFDRMLVAQAVSERLTLVTADRTMREYQGISLL